MTTANDLALCKHMNIIELVGDPNRTLSCVVPLNAVCKSALTFAGEKMTAERVRNNVQGLSGFTLICLPDLAAEIQSEDVTLLLSSTPRLTFMRSVNALFPPPTPSPGICNTAMIHPTAVVDPTAHVGSNCCIGAGCIIGAGTVIHANVAIYSGVIIGSECKINSGTVIGADGFGYERNEFGELEKFPHIGSVVVGNNVEIGSNTSIDRGSIGNTIIKDRARIDNQVHVSHNVIVGCDAAIIAQSMIGGSVTIGDRAWIAPGAVIMNQISIGEDATVGLGAVVVKNVEIGQVVMGSPAQDGAEFKASRAAIKRLTNGE